MIEQRPIAATTGRSLEATSGASPDACPSVRFEAINPAYPRAWWTIAFARDIKVRRAVPLRVLERDLVLWRDSHGVVHCQAGHCPHLGAHLGYGGEVLDDAIRCPFHGWSYAADGTLVAQPGPDRVRQGICVATYRVVERYGALFAWNGDGEPDFDFPDIVAEAGFRDEDVAFAHHRWFLPFPAKWFQENLCDGMHFAVAHDTAQWGDTIIRRETPTLLEMENAVYDRRRWLGWENIKRRLMRRELVNLLTPVTDNVLSTCWAGPLHLVRFASRKQILGTIIACWTPVDRDSHIVMDVTFLPRIRTPLLGSIAERVLGFVVGLGNWSTAIQDAGFMVHRAEPPNPPYGPRDKAMVVYRRFWDGRIVSGHPLEGDNVQSNGARAGIRTKKQPGEGTTL
jgi:phenylpropionate dioxygenase-like ring-hydroxylating dioxygenase large terminal subunit